MKKLLAAFTVFLGLLIVFPPAVEAQAPGSRLQGELTLTPGPRSADPAQMKQQLEKKISQAITILNRILDKIKNSSLPASTKDELEGQIQTEIDWFNQKQDQLAAAQTREDVQQIRRQVKQRWQQDRQDLKRAIAKIRGKKHQTGPNTDSQLTPDTPGGASGKWDNFKSWFNQIRSRYFRSAG